MRKPSSNEPGTACLQSRSNPAQLARPRARRRPRRDHLLRGTRERDLSTPLPASSSRSIAGLDFSRQALDHHPRAPAHLSPACSPSSPLAPSSGLAPGACLNARGLSHLHAGSRARPPSSALHTLRPTLRGRPRQAGQLRATRRLHDCPLLRLPSPTLNLDLALPGRNGPICRVGQLLPRQREIQSKRRSVGHPSISCSRSPPSARVRHPALAAHPGRRSSTRIRLDAPRAIRRGPTRAYSALRACVRARPP